MKHKKDFEQENYLLSESGNIAMMFKYILGYATNDTDNEMFIVSMNKLLEFVQPLLQHDTYKLHRFESPEWTWNALCGRAGFVVFDETDSVIGIHLTRMN